MKSTLSTLTDVKIIPLEWSLVSSSMTADISFKITVFKLFIGGRFSSNVAIPVLSFTVKFTRLGIDAKSRHNFVVNEWLRFKIARLIILTTKLELKIIYFAWASRRNSWIIIQIRNKFYQIKIGFCLQKLNCKHRFFPFLWWKSKWDDEFGFCYNYINSKCKAIK